jgi:hypothetical protein
MDWSMAPFVPYNKKLRTRKSPARWKRCRRAYVSAQRNPGALGTMTSTNFFDFLVRKVIVTFDALVSRHACDPVRIAMDF